MKRLFALVWLLAAPAAGTAAAQEGAGTPAAPPPAADEAAAPSGGRDLAVCVGVNNYAQFGQLKYSVNDATRVRDQLERSGNYRKVFLLADVDRDGNPVPARAQPTRGNIENTLKTVANAAGPEDAVFFFFSGHGIEKDGANYLVPVDGNENHALAVAEVRAILAESRARAKIVVLDACRSGGGMKGMPGVRSSLADDNLAMLVSCGANQFSYEDERSGQGLFTKFLLEALEGKADADADERLTGEEVQRYLERSLSDYCLDNDIMTGQTPAINETGRQTQLLRLDLGKRLRAEREDRQRRGDDLAARANEAYDAKRYEEALALFRQAAELGSAHGQYGLGRCHEFGRATPPDAPESVRWYRLAADQGHVRGQFDLAYAYDKGNGVEVDLKEAVKWYAAAAAQGHDNAQYYLGLCHLQGRGMPVNAAEAARWLRAAAEAEAAKHARAQYEWGRLLQQGYAGAPANASEAVRWFTKAANLGHRDAQFALAQCYETGTGTGQNRAEALAWYGKASAQGHTDAGHRHNTLRQQVQNEQQAAAAAQAQPVYVQEESPVTGFMQGLGQGIGGRLFGR